MCEPTAVACTLKAYCQNRWVRPQTPPLPHTHPNSGPRLRVLKALQEKPDITQRELAARLGVSLGQVNYCVKALVDKGHVKVSNFAASSNKLGYVYLLTPSGVAEKARLTAAFIERKLDEYRALHAEIVALVEAGELPPEELPGPRLGESR
jgi:EPS-associated MarR family transcriptional regulator